MTDIRCHRDKLENVWKDHRIISCQNGWTWKNVIRLPIAWMLPSASTKVGWQSPLLPASSTTLLNHSPEDSQASHLQVFIQVLWVHSTVSYYTGESHKSAVCPTPPCHCRQWMHHGGALLISILWCSTLCIWAEAVITAVVLIRCCVGCPQLPWNSLS